MKKTFFLSAFALAASLAFNVANAQTSTFDPATGAGFAAKGDIQLALGLNNAGFQNTAMNFTYEGTVVSEVSWECTNSNNDKIQERARTTTTSKVGVVSALARDNKNKQITGYYLQGFSGTPTSSSTTDGPAVNSCPSGPWSLTTPAGDPEVISTTGGLFVNGVALPTI